MSVSLLVYDALVQTIEAGFQVCAADGSHYVQKNAWGYTHQTPWKSTRIFDNVKDALDSFLFATEPNESGV